MKKCFLLILLFCALVVNARNECGMEHNDSLCNQLVFPVLVNGEFAEYKLYYKDNGKFVEAVSNVREEHGFIWSFSAEVYSKMKNSDSIRVEVYAYSEKWNFRQKIHVTKPSWQLFGFCPELYIFLSDIKWNRRKFKIKNKEYNYAVRWRNGALCDMNP